MRCKLHVKFVINGNGFYYGRAMASYLPLPSLDSLTTLPRATVPEDMIGASQRPHVFLDPTTSSGGEIVCPFVWYKNALNIVEEDWDQMGSMNITHLNRLSHANGGTSPITVSVFAWAADVSLDVPTSAQPGYTPQSHCYSAQADEYGKGVISRPAGYIAKVAGALSNVPGISMYAKATQMAANAVSSIATMFGYSRPAIVQDIVPYRPTYVGNMANTNVGDSVVKLTLDAKQELTVDPRVTGMGETDEMTIKSIATRESYLTTFAWDSSDTVDTLLWNSYVQPILWANALFLGQTEYHYPACCYASLPFAHWRGTIKMRFQIVSSAYHRGRMRIVYDPYALATNEFNTNYSHVVDISSTKDFTLEFAWGADKSYLHTDNPFSALLPYGTTLLNSPNDDANFGRISNGVIGIYVINELTSPSVTAPSIEINVFVSAGDDFEVANPTNSHFNQMTVFRPQSATEARSLIPTGSSYYNRYKPQSSETLALGGESQALEENIPVHPDALGTVSQPLSDKDHTIDVYFGDPIVSFRQLLKRYGYYASYLPLSTAGMALNIYTLPNFPMYRGFAGSTAMHIALDGALADQPYNYVQMTLLNYVTCAYVTRRGGLRWKYLYNGESSSNDDLKAYMRADRANGATAGYGTSVQLPSGNGTVRNTQAFERVSWNEHGFSGTHVVPVDNNPVVEIELPYQDNLRFRPGKLGTSVQIEHLHKLTFTSDSISTSTISVDSFVSVGEDFNLTFYLGPPIFWYAAYPTPSATAPP